MADTLKILGQIGPAANTAGTIYTVPASTSTSISSVVVCNRDAGTVNFGLSVAGTGAALGTTQHLYFNTPLAGNDTFIATIGITLGATDQLRGSASSGSVTFTAFGVEVT